MLPYGVRACIALFYKAFAGSVFLFWGVKWCGFFGNSVEESGVMDEGGVA